MTYDLLINGVPFFSGSIAWVAVTVIVLIGLLILLGDLLITHLNKDRKSRYEFITIIAHKFRTPLTHIKWTADDIAEKIENSSVREGVEEIKKANEHLINLTGTLIELTDSDNASHASYAFTTVDACDFTRKIGESLKTFFHEKNIFFSVQCEDSPILVSIDKARMEFVLEVLLQNAHIYSPPGKNVEVHVFRHGRKAVIRVSDHGIGMSESDRKRIFTKFFRSPGAKAVDTEGFGVGLYLAQSIVKQHSGKITAESPGVGAGSTFNIVLPAK